MSTDVVIPNWNGAALLEQCLDALSRQSLPPGRVLVVDNGSTDSSREVAKAGGAEWLALGRNAGFAAAANAGIVAGEARLVALLNNDAEPEPGWLQELVRAIDADPAISYCASRMLFAHDGQLVNAAGDAFDIRGRGGYNRGIFEQDGPRFDEPRLVFGACAGAALYRRSLFADIGLFDERFFLSWEDVDLDLRAAVAGHRCLYVPTAVVHHRRGASSGADRVALERRNKAWLAHKGLPLPMLVLFLALVPLREVIETRAAGEGARDWIARVAPYLREAPTAWRWRREAVRRLPLRELWPLLARESLPYEPSQPST